MRHRVQQHVDAQLLHARPRATLTDRELVGRNVLEGRWTFQIVEEYDDGYYTAVKDAERAARDALIEGRRHIYESEMKERERTHGLRHHEARPDDSPRQA